MTEQVAVKMPPWPVYDDAQITAAMDCLRTGRVNQWTGTCVRTFEAEFAKYFGMPHGVAVTNGSLAIELALRAYGIGPGDEVICTSRSFIASSSSIDLVGAIPIFADVDYDTQNISPETIAPHIGPRSKAIIPVHLNGRACDMPGIMRLAEAKGLVVIEDCAQSHGAAIGGRLAGSFGHVAAFSFCQDKIMTTGGEGGLVLFKDEAAYRQAWSFKDHGKSYELANTPVPRGSTFRWLHDSIGSNWRMLEMQAAIGLCQLQRLDEWVATRNAIADRLRSTLSKYNCVKIPAVASGERHAYYRFAVTLDPEYLGRTSRGDIMTALFERGITAMVGPCPEIYLEKAYQGRGPLQRHPNCQRLGETSVIFLVHPTMGDAFLNYYTQSLDQVFSGVH